MSASWKKTGILVKGFGILMLLWAPLQAFSATPSEMMRQANQAFRAGAYLEALSGYLGAESQGEDSALLYYNIGVTHYKLGNYMDAAIALERATSDPKLAPLAYYNLGLTRRAEGDYMGARDWFERAWETTRDPKLEALATKAIIASNPRQQDPNEEWSSRAPKRDPLLLQASALMGYDSNVYRTPQDPYVNPSLPGQPTITPEVQSGFYIPMRLLARLAYGAGSDANYRIEYSLDGDFYYDSDHQEANEYSHKFRVHSDILLGEKGARRKKFSADFFGGYHRESYFDPDDGLPRRVNGVNISDRFSYWNTGINSQFRHKLWWFGYGLRANVEVRDYEDVDAVPEYDHKRYGVGAFTTLSLGSATQFKVGYDVYQRTYNERPAYDLNGNLLASSPELEYRYRALNARVHQKLGRRFSLRADYWLIDREDRFVGYYDYTQHRYQVRTIFRPMRRLRTELVLTHRTFDYPNAFAFNDPVGGPLDMDTTDAAFVSRFRLTRHFSIWSEVQYNDVSSTDPRITYDRLRGILGIQWSR